MTYPPAKQRPQRGPPASSGSPSKQEPRTTFGSVLARSLAPQAEVRAWFDEQLGYQPLSQSKLPLSLPEVLPSSHCALHALPLTTPAVQSWVSAPCGRLSGCPACPRCEVDTTCPLPLKACPRLESLASLFNAFWQSVCPRRQSKLLLSLPRACASSGIVLQLLPAPLVSMALGLDMGKRSLVLRQV